MSDKYSGIQAQFNRVVGISQDIDSPKTDYLFSKWEESKKRFIDAWGGTSYTIVEDVVVDLGKEAKQDAFLDFQINCDFRVSDSNKKNELSKYLLSQDIEEVYQNRVSCDFKSLDGTISISKGMKLSKSLKFFLEGERLAEMQTKLSKMIQDAKITGDLVVSVHPLDFLSASENCHKWHSCHALDGEYRAGNISYMGDSSTFMIYLKSKDDMPIPNFPFNWNSKKWRVFCYLNEDDTILVSGRQYPFEGDYLLDKAIEVLRNKFYPNLPSLWTDLSEKINDVMYDADGSLHFNDCLCSPTYEPKGLITEEDFWSETPLGSRCIRVGSESICLECGEDLITSSEVVVCDDCAGIVICSYCGDAMYEDDCYNLGGEIVCECCYCDYSIECSNCGDIYDEDSHELVYDNEIGEYFCQDCYESILADTEDC